MSNHMARPLCGTEYQGVIIIHNAYLNQLLKLNAAFMPGDQVGFEGGMFQGHTREPQVGPNSLG